MTDGFALELTETGDFIQAVVYGSVANDAVNAVAYDPNGDLFAAGSFAGSMDADPFGSSNPLTPVGLIDGFIVRLGSSFTGIEDENNQFQFEIYPNPATDYIVIKPMADDNYRVSIYNAAGALVYYNENADNNELRIDTDSWVPGTYHVIAEMGQERNSVKIILSGK
jgi:hypothetical protein